MNSFLWLLLILALVLLIVPFAFILSAVVKATLWILGVVLLIAAIIWAFSMLSGTRPTTMPQA